MAALAEQITQLRLRDILREVGHTYAVGFFLSVYE